MKPIRRARKTAKLMTKRGTRAHSRTINSRPRGQDLLTPTRGRIAAVQRLFESIPEDELRAALESSDMPEAERLLKIMSDPLYAKSSFAIRARAAGFEGSYQVIDAILAMYRTDAGLRVARRLPGILESMAEESEPHLVPCPRCSQGGVDEGDIAESVADKFNGKKCPRCRGKRFVLGAADNDVRKMVLETQQLLGQRGPLVDARQLHLHGGGKGAAGVPDMSDWSRGSDAAFERQVPRQISSGTDAQEAETLD